MSNDNDLTLAKLLRLALSGEQRFREGPHDPIGEPPYGCIRSPIPEEIQPLVRLYFSLGAEHAELHRKMKEEGTTERSARHHILHSWMGMLSQLVITDLQQFRPEGAGRNGYILSATEFAWEPPTVSPGEGLSLLDLLTGRGLGIIIRV